MKQLALTLIATLLQLAAWAQPGPPPPLSPEMLQRIKTQKIAFFSERLQLTPEEAQVFWPIYNGYEKETEAARQSIHALRREAHDPATVTDAQAERLLAAELEHDRSMLAINERYQPKFVQALGVKKTWRLRTIEKDFTREVFKRMQPGERGPRGRAH